MKLFSCTECISSSLRVTAATTYHVNGTQITLNDLLTTVEYLRQTDGGEENTGVYVFFDVESLRVTRIAIEQYQ